MKRKFRLPILTAIGLLLLLAPPAPGQDSVTNISRIEVQPGLLTTKLVFRTDALLPVQSTYYAPSKPGTIVIDVDRARTAEVPRIAPADSGLIEDIRVERSGASGLRFYLSLKEKVPYRISSLERPDGGRAQRDPEGPGRVRHRPRNARPARQEALR